MGQLDEADFSHGSCRALFKKVGPCDDEQKTSQVQALPARVWRYPRDLRHFNLD
ncbi:hypothetical protein PF003_g37789 [Phytophthora fragariae]|nr:hypothetical protein PF003_g37789 [Phytophthora fragariae]